METKNSRRKRKDPESRDFKCICDKSYLSYAAAYTHVKNKHQGKKQYLKRIEKPSRENLKRGRPLLKKPLGKTNSTEALSIVEQAILQIYQQLKNKVHDQNLKIILQGNDETEHQTTQRYYAALIHDNNVQPDIFRQPINEAFAIKIKKFQLELNKHFQSEIAAKIRFYLNYYFRKQQWHKLGYKKPTRQQINHLWDDRINSIIEDAFQSWTNINQRKLENNHEDHHQSQHES